MTDLDRSAAGKIASHLAMECRECHHKEFYVLIDNFDGIPRGKRRVFPKGEFKPNTISFMCCTCRRKVPGPPLPKDYTT